MLVRSNAGNSSSSFASMAAFCMVDSISRNVNEFGRKIPKIAAVGDDPCPVILCYAILRHNIMFHSYKGQVMNINSVVRKKWMILW